MHSSEGAELGCRPRSVGPPTLCSSHCLWRRSWEGLCLPTPPIPPPLHIPRGTAGQAGAQPGPHGFSSPTAPFHFPNLHASKAWLPSACVHRPQSRVLRLQHEQLVGSKALSTTGKALMTLPTAKVLMSFPPHPALKLAPRMLKPGKVGFELCCTSWRVVLSGGIGEEGHRQRAAPRPSSAPGKGLSSTEPCSETET